MLPLKWRRPRRCLDVSLYRSTSTWAILIILLLLLDLILTPVAFAEVEGYPHPTQKPQFSLTVTPMFQFPAHLGGGGRLSVTGVFVSADVVKKFDRRLGVGLSFNYDFGGSQLFFNIAYSLLVFSCRARALSSIMEIQI